MKTQTYKTLSIGIIPLNDLATQRVSYIDILLQSIYNAHISRTRENLLEVMKLFNLAQPLDKMAAISLTIFADAFSWIKSFVFWLQFYWSLFLKGPIDNNPVLG